jgi:acetyl esterase/lipase
VTLAPCAAIAAEPTQTVDGIAVWRNLRYADGPGKSQIMDLAMPKERAEKPRPLVVVIHGGGWLEGDKSSFTTAERRIPGNIFDFAARGLAAAAINYRLSGEAHYPAGLDDCRRAIAWLRAHAAEYQLDPERIGAYGNSAGGHLALLLATAEPHVRVRAAASDSGPLDLVYSHQHNQLPVAIEKFLGGPPSAGRLADYTRASPASHVSQKVPPLLLIYGAQDEQVDVRTADDFVAALGRAGARDVSYIRLADAGHCPHSMVRVPYLQKLVEDFFVRTLAPRN